jgi:primosomal protein N' (replication factor Y)
MAIARVALDVPVAAPFDYRTGELALRPGHLVVVPFGRRRQVGVILELAQHSDIADARLRRIERVLPLEPLPSDTLQLIRFCSDYYHHPIGQVALAALPTALRRVNFAGAKFSWTYALTAAGRELEIGQFPARAVVMRKLMAALRATPEMPESQARMISPRAPAVLRNWIESGWVEQYKATTAMADSSPAAMLPGPELTAEQRVAVEQIAGGFGRFSPWLLEGVTGSGKTEVYFRLIELALDRGLQTLLMVPEINLTPQLESRFRERFPNVNMISLHSGLAEGERSERWLSACGGSALVVVGTRLSLFTPLPRLGLVIVDEEHDASFKQQDGVRYSARDMAVFLAQQRRVPVVLGSATPALESFQNAKAGRFGYLRLRLRPAAGRPEIRLVEQQEHLPPHGLSENVLQAIAARRARGEQSLVFLNRRGYAAALMCAACGWVAGCSRCSARLVWHLQDKVLRCHHCGHEERMPGACPSCGNQDLRGLGQGTQRLEQALTERFPDARVLRIDRDSTRRKHAWTTMREDIHADRADILVGTQMLAKGHDFPKLTLVAIVNPDSALYSTDFRAAEKLFQQLMQVAGRAGRAELPGEVLVQTRFPAHPVYQALLRQDYASFAEELLAERRLAGFPPFMFQAVLRAEAPDEAPVMDFLGQAARLGAGLGSGVTLFDPVPAPMSRVAGHHRAQLLAQAASRGALQGFLSAWLAGIAGLKASRVRWSLDVDPVEL